jgi:hypothetical protein
MIKYKRISINKKEADIIVNIWNMKIDEFGDMSEEYKKDPLYFSEMYLRKKLEKFTGKKISENW